MASFDEELDRYTPFWRVKILGNIRRDKEHTAHLEADGWIVIRIWENDIKTDVSKCAEMIDLAYRKVNIDVRR
jgi:DNA mismatch endonuclease (patch repair protein)